MTTVSGIIRDTQGNALPALSVTIRYTRPLVGFNGGAAVQNTRSFVTNGAGLLTMADLVPGHYEIFISIQVNDATSVTLLQKGRLTVLNEGPMSLETALDSTIGEITPTILQQAIQAADRAEAARDAALSAYQGRQYTGRAIFAADTAYVSGADRPDLGTVVTAGNEQYVCVPIIIDKLPGLPGWLPFGAAMLPHWGVVTGDPSVAVQNVERINLAEVWCAENNRELLYPGGVIYCEGQVVWQDKVYARGQGVQTNWRPAPLQIGASTPAGLFQNEIGCELRFIGSGVKNISLPWMTNGRHSGFGRDNPRRAYNNDWDERLDLRDFTNQDADGATPATLRQMSAAVVLKTDTFSRAYREGILIRTACDGVSSDGGTGVEGYLVDDRLPDYADYDIGLFTESPWQSEFYRLSVLGYWNDAGVLWTPNRNVPELNDPFEQFRGLAEGNIWRHCIVQSGWVYRSGDAWPVLAKNEGAETISVEWTPSHQFQSDGGIIRIGQTFASGKAMNYTSVTYDDSGARPLLILEVDGDLSGVSPGTGGDCLQFAGGGGPALTSIENCEFYDFSPTSLLQDPAYSRPFRAACEISGTASRAIRIKNTILHPLGPMPLAIGIARDLLLEDCYSEPRQFRQEHGGSRVGRGGIIICGPDTEYQSLIGPGITSIYARGYYRHSSVNMRPLVRFSADWFGGLDGDFFAPRSFHQGLEEMGRTNLETVFEGLCGENVTVGARLADGTFLRAFEARGGNGNVRLARDEAGNFALDLPLTGDAVLRRDLSMTDSDSPEIKQLQNDNGNLQQQGSPTGDGGMRYVATTRQLRLGSNDNPALQLHRSVNGAVAEYRRDGSVVGGMHVGPGRTEFEPRPGQRWTGLGITSPEGTVTAAPGSVVTVSAGTDAGLWFKATGTGNTGWVQIWAVP